MTVEVPDRRHAQSTAIGPAALEQLSTQVLRQTANRLLEEGINRGLQQLLGPKR